MTRSLAAIPVYNEVASVSSVLDEVVKYSGDVLAINDGSDDGTAELLDRRRDVTVLHHAKNRGYGAALATAFEYAIHEGYDVLVTLDCDGQHQPKRIPRFVAACKNVDIVSGSRYLKTYAGDSVPPQERMFINRTITKRVNDTLHLNLTDAFCGFKAYRVASLERFHLTVDGYAMPLELWAQAAMMGMTVLEIPVPLIYLDLSRSFGGSLDDGGVRLQHYNTVLDDSIRAMQQRGYVLPTPTPSCHGECC
jgi:dolichol-phosphate mannosyltransferase